IGKPRRLPVLCQELYRILKGHQPTTALALRALSLATLLKLIPPAATKAAIDYVLLARPIPPLIQEWSPVTIPESPRLRLGILVAGVAGGTVLGALVGVWGRGGASPTTQREEGAAPRQVAEQPMRRALLRG